ncbi:MAG TPA: CopD family protein [Candidatus Nitrosocosmicus sp.]|nr:CopD family protein [Candidatus Nitrosocosmicus sp.]
MISQKYLISFSLIVGVLYTLSFVAPVVLAQEALDDTSSSGASTESVTSAYDAVLKAVLIISQVALVGLIFNHLILHRSLRHNKKSHENNIDQFVSASSYHSSRKLTIFLLICCISIIAFSTGIILLSSYELAQNLEFDMSSAFWIVYSTPVGDVWMLRIVTSFVIIGILMFYRIMISRNFSHNNKNKKRLNQKQEQEQDQDHYQIEFNYGKLDRILLISILVISSFNLYSNSMVSHSNSLDSFSSLAVSVDWIHFMAVSIWIGGLFYLTALFTKRNSITSNKSDIIDKNIVPNISEENALEQMTQGLMYFSFIAVTAISVIGITGLYLAFVHLQNLSFLLISVYGLILIIKLSLAFPMIFIGRYNQGKIYNYAKLISTSNADTKRNTEGHQDLEIKPNSIVFLRKINKSLKIESVLGISVLVAASFLSVTSPPSLDSLNQNLTSSNLDVHSSTDIFASNLTLLYLVIFLSIIISIFGIMNFKKNQKQIKEVVSPSTP